MREIKFRVWDKDSSEMFIIPSIQFGHLGSGDAEDGYPVFYGIRGHSFTDQGGHVFKKENIIIQQYVLTTKDDVEIYEGDIISCDEHVGNGMKDYHRPIAVVMFDGCCWCYSLDKIRNWRNPHQILRFAKNVKVIGNIFENPELLK